MPNLLSARTGSLGSSSFLNCTQPASKPCKNHGPDPELAGAGLRADLSCNMHSLQLPSWCWWVLLADLSVVSLPKL